MHVIFIAASEGGGAGRWKMAAAPASSSSRPIWKCIETVEKKLEDDYEILLEAKEAILKELKHLKVR